MNSIEATPISIQGITYQICLPDADTDYIQKKIRTERQPYELAMLKDMAGRMPAGGLFVDIGANIGNHTLFMASVTGCRVVAFEPNQQLTRALGQSIEINQLQDKISLHQIGLGQTSGVKAHFKALNRANLGGQSLEIGDGEISLSRLDDVTLPGPVALIKIDVEGMELDVLKGAVSILAKDRPLLYVEAQNFAEFQPLWSFLRDMGYYCWDTFNATPTHLFLPKEAIRVDDGFQSLRLKQLKDFYHAQQQLTETRQKLTQANDKYREACLRIDQLKAKIQSATQPQRDPSAESGQDVSQLKTQLQDLTQLAAQQRIELSQLEQQMRQQADEKNKLQTALAEATAVAHQQLQLTTQWQQKASDAHNELQQISEQKKELQASLEKVVSSTRQYQLTAEKWQQAAAAAELAQQQAQQVEPALREQLSELDQQFQRSQQQQQAQQQANAELQALLKEAGEEVMRLRAELQRVTQQHEFQQELAAVRANNVLLSPIYLEAKQQQQLLQKQLQDAGQALSESTEQYKTTHQHLKNARRQLEQQAELAALLEAEQQKTTQQQQKIEQLLTRQTDDRSQLDTLLACQRAEKRGMALHRPADSLSKQLPAALQPLYLALAAQQNTLTRLRELKVACVMDEFSFGSYAPEANFLQLTPDYWQRELTAFKPDLLLIESAWRGKDEIWGNKIGHRCQELVAIVEWCKQNQIPTAFWNKEDPAHFETFLSTAKLFDLVFTTDMDCIHRYKAALQHERVYLLPFAAQPLVNNPIEKYPRKDAFCFAGAYYVRYPDRTRDLDDFLAHLPEFRNVEIYDRNYGKSDPNYMFPPQYADYIVGNLPYHQIDKAYKGYQYAINLNSMKHSQSMFARRVFELLASNTVTVSNYARGISQLFGELVLNSDSGAQIVERLTSLQQQNMLELLRLQALRKVMQQHLYQDRLHYIATKAGLAPSQSLLPHLVILAYCSSAERLQRVLHSYRQQLYPHSTLLLLVADGVQLPADLPDNIVLMTAEQLRKLTFVQLLPADSWCGFMVADDYYGPNYLTDLALATRYSPADVIAKVAHYRYVSADELRLNNANSRYSLAGKAEARSAIFRAGVLAAEPVYQWLRQAYQKEISAEVLAIDALNYCKAVPADVGFTQIQPQVDEHCQLAAGIAMPQLHQIAEQLAPEVQQEQQVPALDAAQLWQLLAPNARKAKSKFELNHLAIDLYSPLPDGKHEYVYATPALAVETLDPDQDGELQFQLEATTGLNLQIMLVFLDADGNKISHEIRYANKNHSLPIPAGCSKVQLALRVYASGTCSIKRLALTHLMQEPQLVQAQSDVLLLTNHYPSYQDLYRNGFVHTRVKAYLEQGVKVDLFRLRRDEPVSWHEYQGIQVCTASQHALRKMLSSGNYRHVLVHFLDAEMWDVLKDFIDQIRVTVWVHGAEIHPWHRRKYNIQTPEQEKAAIAASETRMAFWHSVLKPMPLNLKLIFVSKYFAEEVMEDLGYRLPEAQYQIIHNPINTKLFNYIPKSIEQRKKILSIRPFASRQYANDLTVAAIVELSKEAFFNELEFRIIGDGPLYEETVAPISGFNNVTLEKRFVSQPEIAALHKEYGIFLCPTRWDSQGVSRDEAMASGLVTVTTNIAAIPEFTDIHSSCVVSPEDPKAIATTIVDLLKSAEVFDMISKNAAARIRKILDENIIIEKELREFYKNQG